MLEEPETVVIIEWPERLGSFAIPNAYQIMISDLGGNDRQIIIDRLERIAIV
jgi:tRNA A37 threonylcarbamoyladenosine biosynthesis protein TsaE